MAGHAEINRTNFPPPGCTDCHTHVAGPQRDYPMVSPRAYTPEPADPGQMRAMMQRVGIARIVLVQMSVYGTDNTCMLDGMAALGDCARGVAQLPADCAPAELDRLHAAGIRGIRVNLNTTGIADPDLVRRKLRDAARQCERNGWHLQIFASAELIVRAAGDLKALPVPVVFDHFGLLSPAGRDSQAEKIIRDLLAAGQGWVKLSGAYRLPGADDPQKTAQLARDLHATNPQCTLWGSDWPHTPPHPAAAEASPAPAPYRDIDPADMLRLIGIWFENEADRNRILVANPQRLYFS